MNFPHYKLLQIPCMLFALLFHLSLDAQTADINKGCAPLTVNFTAPAGGTSWFWDFKDGGSSNFENPSNIFTSPGTYEVVFSNTPNGPVVGTVTITVYPKPSVMVTATPTGGCVPLSVQFNDISAVAPGIQITNQSWVFGNGGSATGANPVYTYVNAGSFTVSLELTTNYPSCNITDVFPDLVNAADKPVAAFTTTPAPPQACNPPLTVSVTNTSTGAGPLTYAWNFGNGNTYSIPNPPAQTYTLSGTFPIQLVVTNASGCSASKSVNVTIGNPVAKFNAKDTVCLNAEVYFQNQSPPGLYAWNFGPNAVPAVATVTNPTVRFTAGGPQTVTLSVTSPGGCTGTITKTIFVEIADASFAMVPSYSCFVPTTFNFNALSPTASQWYWILPFGTGTTAQNPVYTWNFPENSGYTSLGPRMDSVQLIVVTPAGCVDTTRQKLTVWPPNARFMPNVQHGCGPLTVTFADSSFSNETIVEWTWLFDDGSPNLVQSNGNNVTHTFTQPGEYEVQLLIRNSAGCVDTSYKVLIEVGSKLTGDFTADKLELCPGETVQFTSLINNPLIDAWHFYSDEDRLWHCFQNQHPAWTYQTHAGPLDVSLMLEYNGCFNAVTKEDYINLKGPIARLHYKTTCEDRDSVAFGDESSGATNLLWTLGDGSTSTLTQFGHTYFPGTYQVILQARNDTSGCPASYDTATVYITNLKAVCTLPEKICEGETYSLGAQMSVGANATCYKGYTWYFTNDRPIRTDESSVPYQFTVNGPQTVCLVVEDINGCLDTVKQPITVYRQDPFFEMSDSLVCIPGLVNFFDLSTSDTTIVDWFWEFGDGATSSLGQQPSHTYTMPPANGATTYTVRLTITDTLGCKKSVERLIRYYKPSSSLFVNPTPNICEGQSVAFVGTQYTAGGSSLMWDWAFGDGGTGTGQSVAHQYPDKGLYNVTMTFTEIGSGCTDSRVVQISVQDYPTASFSTNVDSLSIICYPQNIALLNTSTSDYPLSVAWDLGNGQTTGGNTAATVFPKGTYTVNMIVVTSNGCSDTTSRSFTVVGPEGNFAQDKNFICLGDVINFNLLDTVDVSSFSWSFGDGTTADNINPVSHQYNFFPPSGSTLVKLVLRGEDDACSFTLSQPINFSKVNAAFSALQNPVCLGQEHQFVNTSTDDDTWAWSFGDGATANTETPQHEFDAEGSYPVTLIVTDQPLGCKDTITQNVSVAGLPNFEAIGALLCQGDTATIGLLNPVPGATYTWTPANTVLNPQNAATVQVNPSATTIYTVSVVVDSSGCMDSDTALVFVPGTYTGAQNLDTLVEQGQPVTLPVAFNPAYTFNWSPANPGNPAIVTPGDSTLHYMLTVTDASGCVQSEFEFFVRVFPQKVIVPNAFSPQGDNVNDVFQLIPDGEKGYVGVNFLRIYNRWGQKIFEGTGTDATVAWDGNYKGEPAPVDVYIWTASVKYQTGRVEHLRGEVTLLR
jgi:gliding motility-associated-like protein